MPGDEVPKWLAVLTEPLDQVALLDSEGPFDALTVVPARWAIESLWRWGMILHARTWGELREAGLSADLASEWNEERVAEDLLGADDELDPDAPGFDALIAADIQQRMADDALFDAEELTVDESWRLAPSGAGDTHSFAQSLPGLTALLVPDESWGFDYEPTPQLVNRKATVAALHSAGWAVVDAPGLGELYLDVPKACLLVLAALRSV